MGGSADITFPDLVPDLQIAFWARLQSERSLYLRESLAEAVRAVPLETIDGELRKFAPENNLASLAAAGLRGELVCAVPCLLRARPFLLGYYRLLYGFSQKEFYRGALGLFRSMEERGETTAKAAESLDALCRCLGRTAAALLAGVSPPSQAALHELQLLTLGPRYRGGELNRIGRAAARDVHELIHRIVGAHLETASTSLLVVRNASGREVRVVFADDPDVRIVELLPTGEQPRVSIEIKGGADASNVYNRIGEAEKSHLKAAQAGFREFWTMVRAEFDAERAAIDSPTTGRFFCLSRLDQSQTVEARLFRDCLCTAIGIPTGDE